MVHSSLSRFTQLMIQRDLGKIPKYPCDCGGYCGFRPLVMRVVADFDEAFDQEYHHFHKAYTELFKASAKTQDIGSSDVLNLYFQKVENEEYFNENSNLQDLNRFMPKLLGFKVKDLVYEALVKKWFKLIEHGIISKCWSILHWIWRDKQDCTCVYCAYRDGLEAYLEAFRELKNEYDIIYFHYKAMVNAVKFVITDRKFMEKVIKLRKDSLRDIIEEVQQNLSLGNEQEF
ncbi:hypothetical protein Ciccas_008289 [Cichlidogyrus casuarinus]|uniref:Uncharacterized protein n=1 Tax=Cichlidogyrus casuarinus TaxID=1844966 RepID=A0ABD2Q0D9_9PLAT